MKRFVINSNDAGQRLDKFIKKAVPNLPNSLMQKAIREKNIKLERKRCYPNTIINANEVLEIYLPDNVFENEKTNISFSNVPSLNIAYQDENILIADKQGGILTHGENSLHEAVLQYLIENGEYNPNSENSFCPAPCNRIDRNTCGLVIFAKKFKALQEMDRLIAERKITKIYRCYTEKIPEKTEATITCYLKKDAQKNKVLVSDIQKDGYKEAITKYRIIEKNCLEVELITGRTHQIRATLSHIGCPVCGDVKYGGTKGKLRLCAYKLIFNADGYFEYLNNKTVTSKINF